MAHDDRFSMKEASFELELFLRANRTLIAWLENLALARIDKHRRDRKAAAAATARA